MKNVSIAERIGVREDMPELTEEQRKAYRASLVRDEVTAERLRQVVTERLPAPRAS